MKKLAILAVAGMIASSASAALYSDPSGDTFPGIGHIDIIGAEVLNDALDISFEITVNGDISAAGWGNFMVGIDPNKLPNIGDTAGNGWGRPITMSVNPMQYWIGSWNNAGSGVQLWSHDGTSWSNVGGASLSTVGNVTTMTTSLASLGLSVGDEIYFDIFSSSENPDGAIDSLANPAQTIAGWSDAYDATTVLSYTVVPEPASLSMLALGGLAVARLRRRRS